jgi:hypothetical protein
MLKRFAHRPWLLFGSVFVLFTSCFIILKYLVAGLQVDYTLLFIGNLVLFLATVTSFSLYKRSLRNNKASYIVRMVYGALFSKMMICLVAVLIYIFIKRSTVDKLGLGISFGLYFIYTFAEISVLMQMSKEQKNG